MKSLPFGISSAPEIFQRTVTELLRGIDVVICSFDDILCHTSTVEEHELLLGRVFKKMKEVGLQLNPEKCAYRKSEITFLGHIIRKDGVRADVKDRSNGQHDRANRCCSTQTLSGYGELPG